jgi:hypothetical protein
LEKHYKDDENKHDVLENLVLYHETVKSIPQKPISALRLEQGHRKIPEQYLKLSKPRLFFELLII